MESPNLLPKKFFKTPDGQLGIEWNDGTRASFNLKELRLACPCALCVDENSGERLIKASDIPADLTLESLLSVGRYALGCIWSDGHKTGIYPYSLLRELTKQD